jgi:hypothetical protein
MFARLLFAVLFAFSVSAGPALAQGNGKKNGKDVEASQGNGNGPGAKKETGPGSNNGGGPGGNSGNGAGSNNGNGPGGNSGNGAGGNSGNGPGNKNGNGSGNNNGNGPGGGNSSPAAPAGPAGPATGPSDRAPTPSQPAQVLTQDEAATAAGAGQVAPLTDFADSIAERSGGEIVDAELLRVDGMLVYAIKVLEPSGQLATQYFHARSGVFIGVQ